VYLPGRKRIAFRSHSQRAIKTLELSALAAACPARARMLDIDTVEGGDVTVRFREYDEHANERLVRASVRGLTGRADRRASWWQRFVRAVVGSATVPERLVGAVTQYPRTLRCAPPPGGGTSEPRPPAPASAPAARARPSSAPATKARTPAPARRDPLDLLGGRGGEPESAPEPREVGEDDAYQRRELRPLPPLRDPPAWLTAKLLRRALGKLPEDTDPTELERQLEALLAEARKGPVDGLNLGLVDQARGLYVLAYRLNLDIGGLVVLDARGGGPPVRLPGRSGAPLLKDVAGTGLPEVFVPRIVGGEVSAFPTVWEIYALGPGKRLSRIAVVPKHYSHGSRSESYCFLNRVTFPRKDEMQVETVLLVRELCDEDRGAKIAIPRRLGERQRYQYRKGAGKFLPAAR
jgi:hypothetical protein